MDRPKWTVHYNIVNTSKWIGTGWEFFDDEKEAAACYARQIEVGNCPSKRPYYHSCDKQYLGACHYELGRYVT